MLLPTIRSKFNSSYAQGGKSKKGARREAKGSRGRTKERERLVEERRS